MKAFSKYLVLVRLSSWVFNYLVKLFEFDTQNKRKVLVRVHSKAVIDNGNINLSCSRPAPFIWIEKRFHSYQYTFSFH